MTAEFLGGFVALAAERHGFTSGRVDGDRIATMRMLDYQIERARWSVVASVTGGET